MKFGVLGFSYAGYHVLAQQLAGFGCFTTNLGDNAQTIASRRLFERLGVATEDIIVADRDTLPAYDGPPVRLLMNGVFQPHNFPLPDQIMPIFVGFQANVKTIADNADYLRRFAPIGCRDRQTMILMREKGIDAFVSGCVTLTLPLRTNAPATPRTLVVFGSGAGELPAGLMAHAPASVLTDAEFIFHRMPANEFPLPPERMKLAEDYEARLINIYRDTATLVITPLHHVAAPCIAMGIPTIIARRDLNHRFDMLGQLTPVYTPETFASINWSPLPVDVSVPAEQYATYVRALMGRG